MSATAPQVQSFTLSDREVDVDPDEFSFSDDEYLPPHHNVPMHMEPAIINSINLNLPIALYQVPSLSDVLLYAFQQLPTHLQRSFIPLLPGSTQDPNLALESAELLLSDSLLCFGNSLLTSFFNRLRGGLYHPRVAKSRHRMLEMQEQLYRQRCRGNHLNLLISVYDTKHKLLVPPPVRPSEPVVPQKKSVKEEPKVSIVDLLKSQMSFDFDQLQATYPASFIVAVRDTLLSLPNHSCPLEPLVAFVCQKPEIVANLNNDRTRPNHYKPEEVARMALFYLSSPPPSIMYVKWVERSSLQPGAPWKWVGPVEPPSQQFMAKLHVDFIGRCCSALAEPPVPVSENFTRMPFEALKTKSPQTIEYYDHELSREYQWQEVERYSMPFSSFTFVIRGDRFPVSPAVKAGSRASAGPKAKEHSFLHTDRPQHVTVVSCVRDAAARLPNGMGTRSDVVALLLPSQYVKGTEEAARNVVSGALDRLQGESDPCMKYDSAHHLWLYTHHYRTEQMISQPASGKRKKGGQTPRKMGRV
ncbi:hypothetical protein P9112_002251 [Eukaryota sp. TZLM1-RC]